MTMVGCRDCGLSYSEMGLDLVLPDQQWKHLCPEDAILCANCIVKRAEGLGSSTSVMAWVDHIDYAGPKGRPPVPASGAGGAARRTHVDLRDDLAVWIANRRRIPPYPYCGAVDYVGADELLSILNTDPSVPTRGGGVLHPIEHEATPQGDGASPPGQTGPGSSLYDGAVSKAVCASLNVPPPKFLKCLECGGDHSDQYARVVVACGTCGGTKSICRLCHAGRESHDHKADMVPCPACVVVETVGEEGGGEHNGD